MPATMKRPTNPPEDTDTDADMEAAPRPPVARKGRGAVSNLQGRFERDQREAFDDGWGAPAMDEPSAAASQGHPEDTSGAAPAPEMPLPPLRTQVRIERARSILTRNASPDIPFDVSLNPYRGCEHGCIYCFARPTHAYLDLSPGLDFETRLFARPTRPRSCARPWLAPHTAAKPLRSASTPTPTSRSSASSASPAASSRC